MSIELVEMTNKIGTNCKNGRLSSECTKKYEKVSHKNTHLSASTSYLVNDISKDNILVIRFNANLFPLGILSQSHIVAQKWMVDARKALVYC